MKGEEGVVIVYLVKWQCSFKDSASRYRLVYIIASWSCPGSNSGLLGSWTVRKASVLECNVETWTRNRSAGAKHGGMLLQVCPCTLRGKRYRFRPLYFEIGGFVAQRTGRMLIKGIFQS